MKKLLFVFLLSVISFTVYSQNPQAYGEKSIGRLTIENTNLKAKKAFWVNSEKEWLVQLAESTNRTDSAYVSEQLVKVRKEIRDLNTKINENNKGIEKRRRIMKGLE